MSAEATPRIPRHAGTEGAAAPATAASAQAGAAGHGVPETGAAEVATIVGQLRDSARARIAHTKRFRQAQLEALDRLLQERRGEIIEALAADLGKSEMETQATEIQIVQHEIDHARRHLDDWMRTRPVPSPFVLAPVTTTVTARPLGLVLVIAPWNYPINLTLTPVVDAIAAGNAVVLKPSELASATSAFLARRLPEYLDPRTFAVVEGAAGTTQALLAQKFDHILYTGGERVGRIVYEAAAKQLTPVTLELGGKCPAIVSDGDVMAIARRIAYGKFMNAGQTCVAPDHVLALGDMADKLLTALPKAIREFYGADPAASKDLARIVNANHVRRLAGYLEEGRIVTGGQVDEASRYVAPTVLTDVTNEDSVMQEEIFGPILPVVRVANLDEALEQVDVRPDPLAAYVFTERANVSRAVEERVRAGAIGINATNLHLAVPELPFGGVGASGLGAYHGKAGFEAFSQARPTLSKTTRLDTLRMIYPPYGAAKSAMMRRVL